MSSFVALVGRVPLVAWHDDQLGETLASFRKNKSHIAVVRNVNNTGPVRTIYFKWMILSFYIQFNLDESQRIVESNLTIFLSLRFQFYLSG